MSKKYKPNKLRIPKRRSIKCCFENCNNEATNSLSNNLNKGKLNMCSNCIKDYETHLMARELYFKDKGYNEAKAQRTKELKEILDYLENHPCYEVGIEVLKDKVNQMLNSPQTPPLHRHGEKDKAKTITKKIVPSRIGDDIADADTHICDNCGITIKSNIILNCACGKQFCSSECLRAWHEEEENEEMFAEESARIGGREKP